MNAIEIGNLSKRFRGMYAVDHLNMTVPVGAIYSFIGENGSGKSTTMKLICGHLVADGGEIKLFGRDHDDPGVRVRVGALIEKRDAFPTPVCAGICVCRPSISGLKILMRRSDACWRSCVWRITQTSNSRAARLA